MNGDTEQIDPNKSTIERERTQGEEEATTNTRSYDSPAVNAFQLTIRKAMRCISIVPLGTNCFIYNTEQTYYQH